MNNYTTSIFHFLSPSLQKIGGRLGMRESRDDSGLKQIKIPPPPFSSFLENEQKTRRIHFFFQRVAREMSSWHFRISQRKRKVGGAKNIKI